MSKGLCLVPMILLLVIFGRIIRPSGYIELKKYVKGFKPMDITLLENQIIKTKEESSKLLLTFFQREEEDESNSNKFFLETFRVHNIEVLQYQNIENSGIYTLSGTVNSLFLFLYTLGKDNKNYRCSALRFSTNNNMFTGTIEVSRPGYNPYLNVQGYRGSNIKSKYIGNLENKFIPKKDIKEGNLKEIPPKVIETIKTSRFYYVGLKKEVNEPLYFFKDSDSGRIHKIPLGGFLGEWRLTEKVENNFYFSHMNRRLVISL